MERSITRGIAACSSKITSSSTGASLRHVAEKLHNFNLRVFQIRFFSNGCLIQNKNMRRKFTFFWNEMAHCSDRTRPGFNVFTNKIGQPETYPNMILLVSEFQADLSYPFCSEFGTNSCSCMIQSRNCGFGPQTPPLP